jgi:aryl-alcohol dehydrogenase-like predicted oxidoreductase
VFNQSEYGRWDVKYRYVGKTGLLVSRVCLGTMTFGNREWGCNEKASIELIRIFSDAGGNFIDTADLYSSGGSEIITGKAIKDFKRDDIVLATKCWFRTAKTPNAKGLSRKHIIEACDGSLKRLQTDYIDLYQIHGPDPHTPLEETMRALDDLVRHGKVRYVGCSNLYAWQVLKANGISTFMNLERLCCGQYLYNLIVRDVEREVLPACDDQGMGFICWSPLGAGMLTGKYKRREKPEEGTRIALTAEYSLQRYWHERGFSIIEELIKVSEEAHKPPALVALGWLLHDKRTTSVIVGARRPEQLRENLRAGDWDLPDDMWSRLSEVAEFDHGYPKSWMDATYAETFGDEEF